MSKTETFERWLNINISHEYYNSGNIPMTLSPTEECRIVLRKNGILLRNNGPGNWVLLRLTGELAHKQYALLAKEGIVLKFELSPSLDEFFYLTPEDGIETKNKDCRIEKSDASGVWRTLEVPLSCILNKEVVTFGITIQCRRSMLGFILIAKYNSENIILKLNEERNRIAFDDMKTVTLRNGTRAYAFTSSETHALQEITPYRIQLWEVRKAGERLLCGNVPLPQYDEISTIGSEKTITTYFYY